MSDDSIVDEVVNDRSAVYDDPIVSMSRIAQVWGALLDIEIQPWQVPIMLIGLKLVRTSKTPEYSDNSDDIEGYLDIFRKVVGDDMIVARTTQEFLAKTKERTIEKVTEALMPKEGAPLRCPNTRHDQNVRRASTYSSFQVCIKNEHHEGACAWSMANFTYLDALDLCRQLNTRDSDHFWCGEPRRTPHENHRRIIT